MLFKAMCCLFAVLAVAGALAVRLRAGRDGRRRR